MRLEPHWQARAGPPERKRRPGAEHTGSGENVAAPIRGRAGRLTSAAADDKSDLTDLPGLIIWPHRPDEALDYVPPNRTAAKIVLTFAEALGVAVSARDDRIEVAGLERLPDNLRTPLSLHLVCLCRSIWQVLTGEVVR
jgi:hypothetical protein